MSEPLAGRGIPTVAVALPSCGEIGDVLGDLYADVDATCAAIEAATTPSSHNPAPSPISS
ncbi:MAG: hypothetical protein GIX01_02780 [Candidatus Eremiobacteraeota bacterium]|nr:hypothetical protein [Candidatus Eremiobacteraeota bacterium]